MGGRFAQEPLAGLDRNTQKTRKKKKKDIFSENIPPSAKTKFKVINNLAKNNIHNKLSQHIDSFFNDRIRNAFSHSDYILTEQYFRFTEGAGYQSIDYKTLDKTILNCIYFYNAFIQVFHHWKHEISKLNKFHKLPNYEVLEILSNDTGVYGFNVHFSNGSKASYTRTKEGSQAMNLIFNNDGTINFFLGYKDKLELVWKVNGKPVENWEIVEKNALDGV